MRARRGRKEESGSSLLRLTQYREETHTEEKKRKEQESEDRHPCFTYPIEERIPRTEKQKRIERKRVNCVNLASLTR